MDLKEITNDNLLIFTDLKMRLANVEDDIEIAVSSNDPTVTELFAKKKSLLDEFEALKESKQKQKNVQGLVFTNSGLLNISCDS